MSQLPEFKKLTLDHKEIFEKYTKKFEPYSDFNFTSIYSYDTKSYCEFAEFNDSLVIRYRDYITDEPFYSFIGNTCAKETIDVLMDLSVSNNISPILKLVPEITVMSDPLLCTEFRISEDRDSFDYILSIDNLVNLTGNKFYKHKNVINRFKETYPKYELRILDLNEAHIRADIMDMIVRWSKITNHSEEETQTELTATGRLLDGRSKFDLVSLGVYIDGTMAAFSIEEVLTDGFAIAHFGKADKNYIGIYKFIEHESAKVLSGHGCKWLNYEQDLGIEGLRHTKELWYPVKFLKKYTIEKI